ncbi:arginine deiminase-related protein [uncultured Aquitalea sp.]|uniref:arginine deiminase-related protein n=1 Tax=uncultured Aquitalea sp. TaxID=540272 RepID=UPI0025FFE9F3|nr:arginine deiminase-related protein [uncultured Aquitalea sp.]
MGNQYLPWARELPPARVAQPQLARAVVMVRPYDFAFNEQTGADNVFQHRLGLPPVEVTALALCEFDAMTARLARHGLKVMVMEKSDDGFPTPDAVFPNNWFTTSADGTLSVYPMHTANRRRERRVEQLARLLLAEGYQIHQISWMGQPWEEEEILEGTGVMIFDHPRRRVYAARSQRCHPLALYRYARLRGIEDVQLFDTADSRGVPIYHTNVMMSVGREFAVICGDSLHLAEQRKQVLETLRATHEVIDISHEQVEKHFCGNILQLETADGTPLIAMSESAWKGFTPAQQALLEKHGQPVINPIPTIEAVGGGSCRCMLAEIFLPRAEA